MKVVSLIRDSATSSHGKFLKLRSSKVEFPALRSSRKYPYSPTDSGRPKNLKKCMKLNWNFRGDGEVLGKIPCVGEVWIFSGTTCTHSAAK